MAQSVHSVHSTASQKSGTASTAKSSGSRTGSPSMKSGRSGSPSMKSGSGPKSTASASGPKSSASAGSFNPDRDIGTPGTTLEDDAEACEEKTLVIPAQDFQKYCHSKDIDVIHDWCSQQLMKMNDQTQEQFLRRFVKAHFFINSGQADRGLSDFDTDVLIWLKRLYETDVQDLIEAEDRAQTLPYERTPQGFWRHFFELEDTISKINPLWTKTNPPMIYGLKSYRDSIDILGARDPGTFLLRISNSEPWRLVAACKSDGDGDSVVQRKINDVNSEADVKKFLDKYRDQFLYLWDEEAQRGIPVAAFMEDCSSVAYLSHISQRHKDYEDGKSMASMRSSASKKSSASKHASQAGPASVHSVRSSASKGGAGPASVHSMKSASKAGPASVHSQKSASVAPPPEDDAPPPEDQ